jgi:hypothetical protein
MCVKSLITVDKLHTKIPISLTVQNQAKLIF